LDVRLAPVPFPRNPDAGHGAFAADVVARADPITRDGDRGCRSDVQSILTMI
jgi:hypothetical protein